MTSWNDRNPSPKAVTRSFPGSQGYYRIKLLPRVMMQQWLSQPAYFPSTSLYRRKTTVPQIPPQHHMFYPPMVTGLRGRVSPPALSYLPPGFSPYGAQNIHAAHTPLSAPAHHPRRDVVLPLQNWKKPAKPLRFRKPSIAKVRTPKIPKKSQNSPLQPSALQLSPPDWTKQAPSRYRKPVVARTEQKKRPPMQAKVVQVPPEFVSPTVPVKVHSVPKPVPKQSHSSLGEVIKSKKRVIARFELEREQYSKNLVAHNRMVAKAIKAFESGNNDLGGQLMIETNKSFGSLNQANKKMMTAQREAFLASIDVDNVHNANEDEPIPASFLQFQQRVKDINALIADVNYYLRENLKIPITPDGGFQKTWCRLGAHLIKVSKELGQ